ncbi:MAG TPA: OmpA family protein [Pirellulales bacterium]|nr:OmpA family protein [Pirellulales bacterium]
MRAVAAVRWPWILPLAVLVGCAQNSLTAQSQVQSLQQQQVALAQRNTELQTRALALDKDNQELQTMLGQSQQQSRLLEDQVAALRDQLGSATSQLAKVKEQTPPGGNGPEAWTVSAKPQAGAKITANNSLKSQLPAIDIPGVQARADGDVVRIEIPSSRLFSPGTARLLPEASPLLDTVAADIVRLYPNQIVGIEGHTDNDSASAGKWQNNHQLSIGEALAVYDYVSLRSRLQPGQLFVVGHGPNHPIVSNGTAAGKERNRRVELVIYPERTSGR